MSQPLDKRFEGTWRFANEKEEDGWNYLHFSGSHRIVQFFHIRSGAYDAGRCLVAIAGPDTLQFRPQGGGEGWTRNFAFDDESNLTIIEGAETFPCTRLPEIPEWLEKAIAESEAYFDKHEANWDS